MLNLPQDGEAPAAALMIPGQAIDHDYFGYVAALSGLIVNPGSDWVASLIAALRPAANSGKRSGCDHCSTVDEINY